MRIISDEADLLFDALITADRALHKLMHSLLAEVAEDHMSPYLRSLTVLRKEVFGFQGDRRQQSSGQDSFDQTRQLPFLGPQQAPA
jgi:hypothetical protein